MLRLLPWLIIAHAAKDCAERRGGAFITLQVGDGQHISQWLEDDAFIDTAIMHATRNLRGRPARSIPVFNRIMNGTDCDRRYSWHVDPHDVGGWEEVATEVCDASPAYIEKNGAEWMRFLGSGAPGQYQSSTWRIAGALAQSSSGKSRF
eukprot:CAMPEP_0181439690 /NCGR_PEP_ID=MMETSP1110-20121109/22564_1 /TAXON_ID=174948 /ORGANISM="Symbiodinium sp., Strain CCMP421" /LENGTH=148 /DNA_ID=CAMNT_0023563435 /DNA_START=46 /DNA_END=493 /DNA_ORIENTATION=+